MRAGLLAAVGVAAIALSGAAFAQDEVQPAAAGTPVPPGPIVNLRDALVKTYDTNPTIMAERQGLRQTDESVAIARAAGRPQIDTSASLDRDIYTRNILGRHGASLNVSGTISVPVYSGGRVRNSVRAANIRVEAGRADLRATEGDIFTEAVAAYMDVIRDRSIVQLNQNQVRVLETNLQATRDRFEVGDLTRTDVAQSDARLALARSDLAIAQGRLRGSEENYERVIGVPPGDLQAPPPLPVLPQTAPLATDVALANNADLAAIAARARAAGFDVAV
ncbi:MAG TPA: TolC family protein, partial [Allosphingosinicella sp.]|nr:TolC family protein [Allosphingosinicella sp.]